LRSRLRGLPALLQTSGLAPTCAFLLSKGKVPGPQNGYWVTAKTLLDEAVTEAGLQKDPDPIRMLDTLSRATEQQSVIAETRAAMLAIWLSRLAQAKAIAQGDNAHGVNGPGDGGS
jgi:CRISPR type III-B/RAMP module-associated protein Cmr5